MSDTAPHSCTRLTILLIGAFAAALSACSQPRVTGQVLDGSGKPLSGATVNVENTTFTTITDDAGRYSVEYIPGKVQVSITKQGYTSERLALEIATKATYPAQSVKLYLTLTRESAEALIRPQIGGIATITVEVGHQFRDKSDMIAQHFSISKHLRSLNSEHAEELRQPLLFPMLHRRGKPPERETTRAVAVPAVPGEAPATLRVAPSRARKQASGRWPPGYVQPNKLLLGLTRCCSGHSAWLATLARSCR